MYMLYWHACLDFSIIIIVSIISALVNKMCQVNIFGGRSITLWSDKVHLVVKLFHPYSIKLSLVRISHVCSPQNVINSTHYSPCLTGDGDIEILDGLCIK